jgi:hypothetical protein
VKRGWVVGALVFGLCAGNGVGRELDSIAAERERAAARAAAEKAWAERESAIDAERRSDGVGTDCHCVSGWMTNADDGGLAIECEAWECPVADGEWRRVPGAEAGT